MLREIGQVTGEVHLLTRAAIYAVLYVVLTLSPGLGAISFMGAQFRVSEGLLPLAFVDPAAVVGIAVGTLIANVASPLGPIDVVLGTLWTVIVVLAMYRVGPRLWALLIPVVVNGIGVGFELWYVLGLDFHGFLVMVAQVALGEAAVMATVGVTVWALAARYWYVLGLSEEAGRRLGENPLIGRLSVHFLDAGRHA